jgi:hypothetical protein
MFARYNNSMLCRQVKRWTDHQGTLSLRPHERFRNGTEFHMGATSVIPEQSEASMLVLMISLKCMTRQRLFLRKH